MVLLAEQTLVVYDELLGTTIEGMLFVVQNTLLFICIILTI